jgi:glutamate formiminotransferase/formiminotetrahydrofolate cyclodeaminase
MFEFSTYSISLMNPNPETFFKILDPEDTTTGGGSASALAGSMAGALLAMVCLLSTKEPHEAGSFFHEKAALSRELSDRLLTGGQEDTHAFQAVRSAYRLPKESKAERETRQQAIQSAWFEAACVPLDNAARCLQIVSLGAELASRINPNVRSDLNCALLLARAGVLGCLENVAINLPNLKDATLAMQLAQQAESLRGQLELLAANNPTVL